MDESFEEAGQGPLAMYVYSDDEVIEPGQAPKISLAALNERPGFLRSECFESTLDTVTVPLLPEEVLRLLRRPSSRRLRQPTQEPLNLQPSEGHPNPLEIVGLTPLVPYSQSQSVPDPSQGVAPSQDFLFENAELSTESAASLSFLEILKLSPFLRGSMHDINGLRDLDPPDWMERCPVSIC
ncbi:hypothetical protein SprV_0702366900 [Sparganum proliferum]